MPAPLQRTQIVRYFAKFFDHFCIAEFPGGRIACPAERNGSHMSRFARQRFRAHDDRHRIEAFGWFAGRNAIVGSDKGQRATK